MFSANVINRFWSKVDKTGHCWEWTSSKHNKGYGQLSVNGSTKTAHRMSWMIHNNSDIPSDMCVCHSCDNPSCVNPDHLFLGSHADNVNDKVSKNRHAVGEKHGMSKLTDEDIRCIRIARSVDRLSCEKIALRYNVAYSVIERICRKQIWTHVV